MADRGACRRLKRRRHPVADPAVARGRHHAGMALSGDDGRGGSAGAGDPRGHARGKCFMPSRRASRFVTLAHSATSRRRCQGQYRALAPRPRCERDPRTVARGSRHARRASGRNRDRQRPRRSQGPGVAAPPDFARYWKVTASQYLAYASETRCWRLPRGATRTSSRTATAA